MKFKIEIDCDNAAFEETNSEIARILRLLTDHLSGDTDIALIDFLGPNLEASLRDSNGNRVGRAWVERD